MPLNGLHAAHLMGKDESALEPQRSNNGILEIEDLPGEGDSKETLQWALATFDLPNSQHGESEIHYLNEVVYYAGKRTYDPISLELNRFFDRDVAEIIHRWYGQVQNVGGQDVGEGQNGLVHGGIGLARDYKKSGSILIFGPNGQQIRSYELIGIWPQSITPNTIDMSSDEGLRMNVSLRIDKYRYLHNKTPGAA